MTLSNHALTDHKFIRLNRKESECGRRCYRNSLQTSRPASTDANGHSAASNSLERTCGGVSISVRDRKPWRVKTGFLPSLTWSRASNQWASSINRVFPVLLCMQTAHGAPNPVASVIGRTHNSEQTSDFSQCKALHNSGIGLRTACAHNCSTVWLHPRVIIMLVVGRVSVPLASVVVVLVVLAGVTFNLQPVSAGPWRRNGNALPRRVAESDEYLEFGRKLKQSCGYEVSELMAVGGM